MVSFNSIQPMTNNENPASQSRSVRNMFVDGWHQFLHVDQSRNGEAIRGHVWSNDDLDPTPRSRQTWTTWSFFTFWMAESWNSSVWSVGSSLVASGLLWWHTFLAVMAAHLIASIVIIVNGRAGAMYHIGYSVQIRASFGMWGSYWPLFSRAILAIIWFSIQSYFLGQFVDVCFQCIFGSGWTNLHNDLPTSAGITTRQFVAYFIGWLTQIPLCFVRPHNIKWLFTAKAIAMPIGCFGLFIFTVVRAGGPGDFQLTTSTGSSSALAFAILNGMNSAINGDFGPLITSEPDISRYARRPRDQFIGQVLSIPWANTIVALLGIIAASASAKIYGQAYWNPYLLLGAILQENPTAKTKAAVFFCSFAFAFGQLGVNVSANLIPFGADGSALLPRYINIVRGQLICALVGFAIVPWLILTSGATFLQFITGYGIFMSNIVAIMIADYFFVSRGNMVLDDLYTSNPKGIYYYSGGWNWRAYVAYLVGLSLAFPGFLGSLGVKSLGEVTSPAHQMFTFGWILSFVTAGTVYVVVSRLFPPPTALAFKDLRFEELSPECAAGRESADVYDEGSLSEEVAGASGDEKKAVLVGGVYPAREMLDDD